MKNRSTLNHRLSPIKKVLIVEDSATVRQYLSHVIDADPGLQVIGTARDGEEGVKLTGLNRPDVVTMDIHMPKMDGYQATRRIMEECPVPIVIVTSNWDRDEVKNSFRAIEAGALAAVEKPPGPGNPRSKPLVAKLIQTIKTMSEVRVVRRLPQRARSEEPNGAAAAVQGNRIGQRVDVVAIGASTGGPPVIRDILSGLRKNYPVPLLIVQHITPGFLEGMVDWLNKECGIPVKVGMEGERIQPGVVYFAPDGVHMGVAPGGRIMLNDGPSENGVRPSVSYLFRSVAASYGMRGVGVLLTGMGRDGATELGEMKARGAITVAQDKVSCVVYGMPAEAVRLNGAVHVLSPDNITGLLNSIGA